MNPSTSESGAAGHSISAHRRSLYWRIHFWAALIASPFALLAALTGILYIFTPQIESALYGSLEHVAPRKIVAPLDVSLAAARAAAPAGWVLNSVIPPHEVEDTIKATFAPAMPMDAGSGHEGHNHGPAKPAGTPKLAVGRLSQSITIFVNPYTADVTGTLATQDRFSNWAKRLHSRLLQGDGWRWMIELAASWLMVMLLTGIALWWPGAGQKMLPQRGVKGRAAWKQWHAFLGVVLGVITLTMLATGLTWSRYSGNQIRALRDVTGQAPPQVPRDLKSIAIAGAVPLTWQAAADAAHRYAPDVALQLTPPTGPEGTWRATNADRGEPRKRFDLVLDAYTGRALYYSGWDQQTAFAKATAIGIPFHRGEFGWWNQALLLVFGIGVLFSIVSGWTMYLKRRQPGSLGVPRLLPGAWKSAPIGVWITAVAMLAAMPLLALSTSVIVMAELSMRRK